MTHPVDAMLAEARKVPKGTDMLIKAAYRATGYLTEYPDEAAALVIERGWTWDDVLNANS